MQIAGSPDAALLVNALLREPDAGKLEWENWVATVNLDDMDADSFAVLPLLAGRLAEWLAEPGAGSSDRNRILGICKRAWARNQLHCKEAAGVWTLLRESGMEPMAIGGCAAWALLFAEEKAVRPMAFLQISVTRRRAKQAVEVLRTAGWSLEPGMPEPTGRVLDQYEGVWLRSPAASALFLAWRLRSVAPALAEESETAPFCDPVDLAGTNVAILGTEELLLDALTRQSDAAVSWECDAMVLLRNRSVDWARIRRMAGDAPVVAERMEVLRKAHAAVVPVFGQEPRVTSALLRRLEGFWVSYRNVAWERQTPRSAMGFVRYVMSRAMMPAPGSAVRTVIDATERHGGTRLAEYRNYRSLFFFLTMRDIRLRYSKTWRGVLWALLQPVLPMLIFAVVLSNVMRPELQGSPYWLFVLSALAPWNVFANAVNYASVTFINNFSLVNKVYFPRVLLPAAAVAACLVDVLVTSGLLVLLAWWMGYPPSWRLLLLPLVMLAVSAVALASGIAAASANALHRDLKALVPFLVQVWMYATPVFYPVVMIPAPYRLLAWLNPMTGIIETFRHSLFGTPVDWVGNGLSALAFCGLVCVAGFLFRRVEADLAEKI